MKTILISLLCVLSLLLLVACNDKSNNELDAYKESANSIIDNYKNANDYRATEKIELENAKTEGKKSVANAKTKNKVDAAVTSTKAVIDKIKTNKQLTNEEKVAEALELVELKKNAKLTLSTYKSAANYYAPEQAELLAAIERGEKAIDAVKDKVSLENALANAKDEIGKIKTKAQIDSLEIILDAAKLNAHDVIDNYKDILSYRIDEQELIINIKQTGKDNIDKAETVEEVEQMIEDTILAIDAIKTIGYYELENVIGQFEDIDEAKQLLVEVLGSYKNESDYNSEEINALRDIINAVSTLIYECNSYEILYEMYEAGIKELDKIKTKIEIA